MMDRRDFLKMLAISGIGGFTAPFIPSIKRNIYSPRYSHLTVLELVKGYDTRSDVLYIIEAFNKITPVFDSIKNRGDINA
jgi:hypothetical protein